MVGQSWKETSSIQNFDPCESKRRQSSGWCTAKEEYLQSFLQKFEFQELNQPRSRNFFIFQDGSFFLMPRVACKSFFAFQPSNLTYRHTHTHTSLSLSLSLICMYSCVYIHIYMCMYIYIYI